MRRVFAGIALALAIVMSGIAWGAAVAATSPAGKRIALVIGNSAYQFVPPIKNPRNDAEDIAAALTRLGFEVTLKLDLDKQGFSLALAEFGRAAATSDVALVYYGGQGVEVGGRNWLGPIDMRVEREEDVASEMQSLDAVIAALQSSRGVKIAVIDACRDNPFSTQFGTTRGTAAHRGLARVSPDGGTAYVMSASPGQVALDGEGRNSPFTAALLTEIEKPDVELSVIMRRVVANVVGQTDGRQQPWFQTALVEDFYFSRSVPGGPPRDRASAAPVAEQRALQDQEAEKVWKIIGSTGELEQIKSFVITYPKSRFVEEAFEKLAALAVARERQKAVSPAGPQRRVALVIGNGEYRHSRPLKNPASDAEEVATALKRIGFEVRMEINLDKRSFDEVMPEFAATAAGADIALVYFSGHAIEFQGAAYVMPVDARPISRSHIRNQLKSVRDIVFDLENVAGLKLVVVDGCRDNPLASRLFGMLGLPRSATGDTRGFSVPEAEQQKLGELIVAFATLQGEVAYDGGAEPNSPFTTAFLKHVDDDGVDVDQLFRIVKDEVMAATKGLQNPAIQSYRGIRPFVLHAPRPQPAAAK